jgi:hypothetical protein
MNALPAAIMALLVACSSQAEPVAPAGVTILPVDSPPPSPEPEVVPPPLAAPPAAPEFQICECDGSCMPTPVYAARVTDIALAACEKRQRASAPDAPRDQRVVDCLFPKSGTRLQLCPVAPANRPDFNGYLRSAVRLPRDCFDSARVRGPVWGATEVTFRVGSGGYPQDVRVDTKDARFEKCIADSLKQSSFVTHAGDVTLVRYRLVFDMPR